MKVISREEARAAGLNKYFTGVPCKHGHIVERRVSYTMCVECDRLRQLSPDLKQKVGAWREANRESIKKRHKEYVAENADHFKEVGRAYRKSHKKAALLRQAKYRKAHPDRLRVSRKQYKIENKDKVSAQTARAYKRDPQKFIERSKRYAKNHPDIMRARGRTRRALVAGASGKHTAADIREIRKMQSNKCAYCKISLSKAKSNVDHIKPLARGGTNDRRNLQLLCQPCNNRKHAKDPLVFARQRGLLL